LVNSGHISRTHGGTKGLFGKYFVVNDLVSKEQNKLYEKLFTLRQSGDYNDWITIEKNDIQPLFKPAEQFIKTIKNLIDK
jgi:uncharacterized protein (UPF0332 family)